MLFRSAIAILGEPVGAALLAYLFFGEQFGALQFAGFIVLLLGIIVAARDERLLRQESVRPNQAV